jgi:hypothetical protein
MALRLELRVVDTETNTPTDMFTQLDLTPKELGNVNMLIEALFEGLELGFVE